MLHGMKGECLCRFYIQISLLRVKDGQQTFLNRFRQVAEDADQLDIAVGYVSKGSLLELDKMIDELKIQRVRLNMGDVSG